MQKGRVYHTEFAQVGQSPICFPIPGDFAMSEQENLQTAQRFYQLVNAGDIATVSALMTDDVDWKDAGAGNLPWSTWCCGREEFERYGRTSFEVVELRAFRPDEFMVGRDSVVVLGFERLVLRASNRVVEANWVQVFSFRDGLICRFREYSDMVGLGGRSGEAIAADRS